MKFSPIRYSIFSSIRLNCLALLVTYLYLGENQNIRMRKQTILKIFNEQIVVKNQNILRETTVTFRLNFNKNQTRDKQNTQKIFGHQFSGRNRGAIFREIFFLEANFQGKVFPRASFRGVFFLESFSINPKIVHVSIPLYCNFKVLKSR